MYWFNCPNKTSLYPLPNAMLYCTTRDMRSEYLYHQFDECSKLLDVCHFMHQVSMPQSFRQSSANEARRLHYELSRFQVSSWLSFRHYCWFEFYNIKYFSIYHCNLSRIFHQWVQVYGWTELKMFFSEEPICVAWMYLVCYRYVVKSSDRPS